MSLNRQPINAGILVEMNQRLKHRGPDDEGYVFFNRNESSCTVAYGNDTIQAVKENARPADRTIIADVGLGFRRLSVIDLSARGHQPMTDISSRYWIVYNGEIYNFLQLREELKLCGVSFVSETDTEMILYAYHTWGESCVNRFNGMWAFAIYDTYRKRLFCSRDRYGIKPFYYAYNKRKGYFAFASEIKALLCVVTFEVDNSSVYDYLYRGLSCHNEFTFFKGIEQLKPGNNLLLADDELILRQYYTINRDPLKLSFEEARYAFHDLLADSIRIRRRADVPLGYALSGGLDSSSIVSIAAGMADGATENTFSLVFLGDRVDESVYADEVIRATGFLSHKLTLTGDDLPDDLLDFAIALEQPFGGLSYYGEYKLKELMHRSGITVSLEGQGADEIISGYNNLIPYYLFDLISEGKFMKLVREYRQFRPNIQTNFPGIIRMYLMQLTGMERTIDRQAYPSVSWDLLSESHGRDIFMEPSGSFLNDELYRQLMVTSIPEQLIKADKSAMHFSVESRFPFLDYRLVELAGRLPSQFKLNNGLSKYILREALKKDLPDKIYRRRDKIGFAVPEKQLMSEKLWNILMDYLDNSNLAFLDAQEFRKTYPVPAAVNWRFWKIISLVIWEVEFSKLAAQSYSPPIN
jgi:asparagine synthase (glutamine-hydrolysing)